MEVSVLLTPLYFSNQFGELIAVAKLNQPQKKNWNTELTIAAKLNG